MTSDSDLAHFHGRYFAQLVLYQIMIAIQLLLVVVTWKQFRENKQAAKADESVTRLSGAIRRLYTVVLLLGTTVFLLVEWYGIADFLYDFAGMDSYCHSAAIILNVSLMTYLLALYIFYLYRLHATFKGSRFALSKRLIIVSLSITILVYLVLVISVFYIEKGAVKHTLFAWSLSPSDYKPIIICEGEFSIGLSPILRWSLQCIIIIANSYYGYIFYRKLYQLILYISEIGKDADTQKDLRRIYKVMRKQTSLVIVSTVSTTIFWSVANILHYFGSFLQVLIYLDISINCCCLWLMFKWNDKAFHKFCKVFIWMNEFCCFKSVPLRRISHQLESIQVDPTNSSQKSVKLSFNSPALKLVKSISNSIRIQNKNTKTTECVESTQSVESVESPQSPELPESAERNEATQSPEYQI